MRLAFGGLIVDTDARQLLQGSEPVPLSPKALDLLAYLIENRPNALSKDMLHDRLWPGVFVSDTNLAGLIAEIRRALGDDARTPRYIRTVQRFGYAFAGTVESEGTSGERRPAAGCWLVQGKRQIALADGENIVGRDQTVGPLASNSVSRRHARITVDGTSAYLEDLGSKNGTFLRGRSVSGRETLADGDTIKLGAVAFVFRAPASDRSTRTWKKGKL
jgi:DNA-binding winged helix-turn-helix (wHTH) protein